MNITKTTLEKLTIPQQVTPGKTVQKKYYDNKLKGFGVRVTSGGSKAFFVEKKIKGTNKLKRITIARYPELTVEQARVEAQKMIGQMVTGNDPSNTTRRQIEETKRNLSNIMSTTFEQAFKDYIADNTRLKASTAKDYAAVVYHRLKEWLEVPLSEISDTMVIETHRNITKTSPAQANYAFRIVRAVFNFAMHHYKNDDRQPIFLYNPTTILKKKWNKIERRQTVIKPHQLKDWFNAVLGLTESGPLSKADLVKDYLLLLVFTGLRRQEGAAIKWKDIDFNDKSIRITNTKNGKPHTLPCPDYLLSLLSTRKENTFPCPSEDSFVFPGSGTCGHLVEPKKQVIRVIEAANVEFCIHDLRRSFATYAHTLELPYLTIKRLLNHSMKDDVTNGYIIPDVEQLRKPMQKIEDYILTQAGLKKTTVVTLVTDKTNVYAVDSIA